MENILEAAQYSPIVNGEGINTKSTGSSLLWIGTSIVIVTLIVAIVVVANKRNEKKEWS